MSLVTLVSGGIDSTLMALLAKREGLQQHPLFIDYGQLCAEREWNACRSVLREFRLPEPTRMDLNGFGRTIPCGLTSRRFRVNEDAFLPGRNLLFLVAGAAYAYSVNARAVAIGLLSERYKIFPDQTAIFLKGSNALLNASLGTDMKVVAPLMGLSKGEVLKLARKHGISRTYSCHSGGEHPCGRCISCQEIESAKHRAR